MEGFWAPGSRVDSISENPFGTSCSVTPRTHACKSASVRPVKTVLSGGSPSWVVVSRPTMERFRPVGECKAPKALGVRCAGMLPDQPNSREFGSSALGLENGVLLLSSRTRLRCESPAISQCRANSNESMQMTVDSVKLSYPRLGFLSTVGTWSLR